MNRRRFIICSGTALLGINKIGVSEPAVSVDFQLDRIPETDPDSVSSIAIEFTKLELKPKYIENTQEATINISTSLIGYDNSDSVQVNKRIDDNSPHDLLSENQVNSLILDNIEVGNTKSLSGEINIEINHPEVSESYKRRFTITDVPLPDAVNYHWDHNESSGSTIGENINGLDANINGAEWKKTSQGKSYLKYNGSDYSPIPNSRDKLNFILSGECTIAGWIRPDDLSTSGTITGVYGTSNGETYKLEVSGDLGIRFYVSGKEEDVNDRMVSVESGGSRLSNGEWIVFCVKMNGSQAKIYVGEQLEEADTSSIDQSDKRDRVFSSNINENYNVHFGRRADGNVALDGAIANYWKSNSNIDLSEVQAWVDSTKGNYPN